MEYPESIKQIIASKTPRTDITVRGWVRSKRTSKNLSFLALADGSSGDSLQVIISEESCKNISLLADINTGTSLEIKGDLTASPALGQAWEVQAKDITILGKTDNSYPLQKKGHSLEFLREIGHLRGRTNTFGAMFRLRHKVSMAVHRFFDENGFNWVHTPILTAADCEGAGEQFTVTNFKIDQAPRNTSGAIDFAQDFFGRQAFLTVSGQLEGEFLAAALGKIYTFGPTFRAENSNTTRHLAEFWMIEPEASFYDLKATANLAADFIRYLIKAALNECADELHFFEKHYKNQSVKQLEALTESKFNQITYTEAVDILIKSKKSFEFPVAWGKDMQSEHERYLCEQVFNGPVTVTDYPKDIKAFYMRQNDDGTTVAAMDLLVPGVGELVGGSQREERLGHLEKRMDSLKISHHELQWYLDIRRYGSVVHSGFGLGFERMLMYLTGMQNIRDVIICPRAPKSIAF